MALNEYSGQRYYYRSDAFNLAAQEARRQTLATPNEQQRSACSERESGRGIGRLLDIVNPIILILAKQEQHNSSNL